MSSQIKAILLLSAFILLHQLSLSAQKDFYIFRNINTSAGLASDIVTSIIQDSKGFMWIATINGVQKYDGNSFTSYHHDPYDSQSISSDNAGFLLKDREDNIWILTSFLGFNRFNPSSQLTGLQKLYFIMEFTIPNSGETISEPPKKADL